MPVLLLLLALAQPAAPSAAQPADSLAFPPRVVAGVSEAPPFAVQHADGTWDGVAVHLWRTMGRQHGFEAALEAVPTDALADAVASGRVDVALTLPASAELERTLDFTQPYYTAPLAVARPRSESVWTALKQVFTLQFLWIALGLGALLLLFGAAVWAVERSDNQDEFSTGWRGGVRDGFWWAAVTMTTIGYGDKAPRTTGGRAIAFVWMLLSMGVTAVLTAVIVSALGLRDGNAAATADLPEGVRGERVGVVEGSSAAHYLAEARVQARPFPDVAAGLKALEADSLDAFVGAAPLVHYTRDELQRASLFVSVTPTDPQRWALAVAPGSALREPLNRAVLAETRGEAWDALLKRWSIRGSG